MGKIQNSIICIILFYFSYSSCVSQSNLDRLQNTYYSQIGVREKTNHNDGVQVEKYLSSVGLKKGNAWCSAFVNWCLVTSGYKTKINGMALTVYRNCKNVVYKDRRFSKDPRKGDTFCIYYQHLRRIGHTGFYDARLNKKIFQSVEGNTNLGGSREGDGVYKKYRSFRSIYSITRWTE